MNHHLAMAKVWADERGMAVSDTLRDRKVCEATVEGLRQYCRSDVVTQG